MSIGSKKMIIVYEKKYEVAVNLLKKYIAEDEDMVIDVGAWTEDVWKDNKKTNSNKNKILFIGRDIEDIRNLSKIADYEFVEYGVVCAFAGEQAFISCLPDEIGSREEYLEFLNELEEITGSSIISQDIAEYNRDNEGKRFARACVPFVGLVSVFKDAMDDLLYKEKQQLMFGVAVFYNNYIKEFIGEYE